MSKAILTAVLGTLFKVPTEEITESLKDSDLPDTSSTDEAIINLITSKDSARLKENQKKYKEFGYNDGYKKGAEKIEASLREKYGIEDATLIGTDLFEAVLTKERATLEEQYKKTGKGDDVRKSPDYLELERKMKELEVKANKEKEKAVEELRKEYKVKELDTKKRETVTALFGELKPLLSEDPEKAKRQMDMFLKDVAARGVDYSEDNSKLLLVGEDGAPETNEHGYTTDYAEFVKAEMQRAFDFPTTQRRESPNNSQQRAGDQQQQQQRRELPKAKDIEELAKHMSDKTYTPEERIQMKQTFEAGRK
jgi:hypothetical protein